MRRARAFTIIELLVVVTVIVVLLALLLPAMSRAIVQAQLVVCQASNLRTISEACNLYAADNKRTYPNNRPVDYAWDALFLKNPDANFDMRPLFRPYVPLPDPLMIFQDPLAGQLDYSDEANTANGGNVMIYSNYRIYSGWGIPGFKRMYRVGDAFEFTETRNGANVPYRFPILATDMEQTGYWGYWSTSSHPDQLGQFQFHHYQNAPQQPGPFTPFGLGKHQTISFWQNPDNSWAPGFKSVVANFAYADGSVIRYNQVKADDDRMAKIVETRIDEYNSIDRYGQVPKTQ